MLTPVASSILDFERRIEITEYNSDSNQKKVESKVRWQEQTGANAAGYREVVFNTVLTKWRGN